MHARGHAIPVEDWWLRLARGLVSSDPRDLRTLGRVLAKHVKRAKPFHHTGLSRFGAGEAPATLELVEALCTEFTRLPRPFFFARTYEEAVHMQAVAERYDGALTDNPSEAVVVPMPKARRRQGSQTAVAATSLAPRRRAKASS